MLNDELHRAFVLVIILLALNRIFLPVWVILTFAIIDFVLFVIAVETMFKDIEKELGE